LAAVVNAFNPGRIFVGGEITAAWELFEQPMRAALVDARLGASPGMTPEA
jgi:N-acetylglucosamine repressor